jgi:hypothetical protein
MTNLTSVVRQLKQERDRLGKQIQAIGAALAAFGAAYRGKSGTRTLSAAAREKIAAAQRARWAKIRSEGKNQHIGSRKRTMSASARKKISAAQRARWAKVKAAE